MHVGDARVSTRDQDLSLQFDALNSASCEKVFTEQASGAQRERPALAAALEYMRTGDTLVVWKLDRLARSLKPLIETIEALGAQGVGLRSLTEAIDTTTPGGKLVFHLFASLAEFERGVIRERTRAGRRRSMPPIWWPPKPCCATPRSPSRRWPSASAWRLPPSTGTCRAAAAR
jgi:DNA invertase Pin-like site-specific DNA recombinase